MADLSGAIARTLKRLNVGGKALDGVIWLPKLYAGLAPEFNRVSDYRKKVLAAAVPSASLPIEAADDLEVKYGIENYLGLSDQERINRIVERATGNGSGGADWLQDQIQQAGFPLYVIPNLRQPTSALQWGAFQYDETEQYGISVSRIDPTSVPGSLICSSPSGKAGRRYLTQWGAFQFSVAVQYGTADPTFSYPQPATFEIPSNPKYWGRFLFLSPFADRLAISNGELLSITAEEYRYFRKFIIQTKYLRDWCIAQVKVT